jgi:hypothetical protein
MKYLIATIALTAASAAQAEFWSGNDLHSRMQSQSQHDQSISLGYVMGIYDARTRATHCPPDNITAGQIYDMVKKVLAHTPSIRHFTADLIIGTLLENEWPCSKKKSSGSNV